jgi:hypothetical protein
MLRALAASSGGSGGWVAAATVALDAKVILTPPCIFRLYAINLYNSHHI